MIEGEVLGQFSSLHDKTVDDQHSLGLLPNRPTPVDLSPNGLFLHLSLLGPGLDSREQIVLFGILGFELSLYDRAKEDGIGSSGRSNGAMRRGRGRSGGGGERVGEGC